MKRRVSRKAIGSSVAIVMACGFVVLYFLSDLRGSKGPSFDSAGLEAKEAEQKLPAATETRPSHKEKQNREDDSSPPVVGEAVDLAEVEAALEDPEVAKRIQAILSLRGQPSAEAVALLARFLSDPEHAVVSEAIDALGYIGFNTVNEVLKGQVLDVLLGKAQDKEFAFRGEALIAGAMLGGNDRTYGLIWEYIAEEGDSGTDFAVRALSFLSGPESLPHLSEIIKKTKDGEVLKNAFALLTKVGTPEALALVGEKLSARREGVQVNSAWALSRRNDDASNAILLSALSDDRLSEAALGVVATSPSAAAVFGEALNQNIPKEDKLHFLDVLSLYTISAPREVRSQVAEAIKPLVNAVDEDIRVAAIQAMGKVGAGTDQSETLAEHFSDDSFLVRGAALESFMQYCSPSTYKPLLTLWYDEDEKIRRTAFFFSEAFLNQSDLAALQNATTHSDKFIAEHSQKMIKHVTQAR